MSVLFQVFPGLRARVPWLGLAELPTPVEDAARVLGEARLAGELWLKRDDLSSPIYGGSKLRLLEHLLGEARGTGATHVYATGAVGSNFTLATALHAPRVGLVAGAICFPQPLTPAGERAQALLATRAQLVELPHWSLLPLMSERVKRQAAERGERAVVLSQVRFSAQALLGYVAAGLELAQQVAARACPAPRRIVLPIGSAATSAGLVAGLSLARKLGLWREPVPELVAVRIASWPLSRRARVLGLARRALGCVAELCGDPALDLGRSELVPLSLVTDQLGTGYPHPTRAGTAARELFDRCGLPILDDTYSAKAAAHALASLRAGVHDSGASVLLWCTKSSAKLG